MLPRQFRLSKKEFELARRQGAMKSGRLLGLLVFHQPSTINHQPSIAKAGIIVSKKLSRKATERNRLKRQLRAALVRVLPELSDVHIVVLPTKRAMGATVGEMEEELKRLLNGQNG